MLRPVNTRHRLPRRALRHWACSLLLVVAWTASGRAEIVWELSPYQVRLLVATPDSPDWSSRQQDELLAELVPAIERVVGTAWELSISRLPRDLARQLDSRLDQVPWSTLLEESSQPRAKKSRQRAHAPDKIILLRLQSDSDQTEIQTREWDSRSGLVGTLQSRIIRRRANMLGEAARAIVGAFGAQALVSGFSDQEVRIRLRGSALVLPSRPWSIIEPGDIFRVAPTPATQSDNQGSLPESTSSATLFEVTRVDESQTICRVIGQQVTTPTVGAQLVQLPLATQPMRLLLRRGNQDLATLAGYEIAEWMPATDEVRVLGTTDADGGFYLDPSAHQARRILVRNAGQPLLSLTLVLGLATQVEIDLPADETWLRAQNTARDLERRLEDLVARREALIARLQSRIAAKQWDQAATLLADLRRETTASQFVELVKQARGKLSSSSTELQDAARRLFLELQETSEKYLAPTRIDTLAAEVEAGRQALATPPAGAAEPTPPTANP